MARRARTVCGACVACIVAGAITCAITFIVNRIGNRIGGRIGDRIGNRIDGWIVGEVAVCFGGRIMERYERYERYGRCGHYGWHRGHGRHGRYEGGGRWGRGRCGVGERAVVFGGGARCRYPRPFTGAAGQLGAVPLVRAVHSARPWPWPGGAAVPGVADA